MARTTPLLVGGIIELDDEIPVEPFIDDANDLVTEFCTGTNGPTPAYSEGRLERIERWVSAHLYHVRVPKPMMEGVGSIQESYTATKELGLDNSEWGQMAMRFDSNGGLAAWNQAIIDGTPIKKFGITWLGTPSATDHLYFNLP